LDNHFTILIPSYNAEGFVRKNLGSVLSQKYKNYLIYYVDDNSTDKTYKIAKDLLSDEHIIVRNSFNKGKMDNVFSSLKALKNKNTIVLILDGDDWLFDGEVLSYLNEVYKNPDIWMTSGSYLESDTKNIIRPNIDYDFWVGNIRKKQWKTSHLISFRLELFLKIKRKDFMKKNGEFFSTTSDQAMIFPMIEMAGREHFLEIKDLLYVYNRDNPLSDDKIYREDQLRTEKYIRSLQPYKQLDTI
tara:strand:- start:2984 stop:3715 length:732 start_codon:yes stop_codon:yes gene_type:complete